MNLDIAEALWTLGVLPREQLPNVAIEALNVGLDNNPLRVLAGITPIDMDEAPALFEQAMKELGRGNLSKENAVRKYAQFISFKIVHGEIDPYAGAKEIWTMSIKVNSAQFHDVDAFIYAASEYEDRPEDQAFFRQEIIKEAQRWAAELPVERSK